MTSNITNWKELIDQVSQRKDGMFPKLLLRINQTIRPKLRKRGVVFDMNIVLDIHKDLFNLYRMIYEQLHIEHDIIDILTDVPSLDSSSIINIQLLATGKWIKYHTGKASRIFFFDEEKTVLSDKALGDFLNKVYEFRSQYTYFGKHPLIYYKFDEMPSPDVLEFIRSFNVIPFPIKESTDKFKIPVEFEERVILDQSGIMTICSNQSFGLSDSSYDKIKDHSKEEMLQNKIELDKFIEGKKIVVNQHVWDQSYEKITHSGGPMEQKRFEELRNRVVIVPDTMNSRFIYLKDNEQILVSVAEKECCTIITNNQRLINKIDMYYHEMPYKLFLGAHLVEKKFPL